MKLLLFFLLPFYIPYIGTLLILKLAFHVPKTQPFTLLGIFLIGGLLSKFIGGYFSALFFIILVGFAIFKKYNLTKNQAIALTIIIGILIWVDIMIIKLII